MPAAEARFFVLPTCKDPPERFDRVPDIPVTHVERGKAEPEEVRFPEVSDHPSRNQSLHHRITGGMPERDLTPPLSGLAGTGGCDSELHKPLAR